ncbi:uncharacterized protein V1510DRAFT_413360 [Dipodascopsis tothii]|uniref:uncharacterized protein n=1 Tax=Dipodascopsis tothii TaxID=44089 RepID=UPI0034CED31D
MRRHFTCNGNRPLTNMKSTEKAQAKVWLITDGGSPLGKVLAEAALGGGFRVAVGYKPGAELGSVPWHAEFEKRYGDSYLAVEMDLGNKPMCQTSLITLLRKWQRLDILVLCPCRLAVVGTIEEAAEWHVREQLEVGFYGPVNIITAVLPTMRRQRSGHIVVVTGISGYMGTPSLGLVSAANHALEGYAEAMAFEVSTFDIKVTIVEPSVEATVLTGALVYARQLDHYKGTVADQVRRLVTGAEVDAEELVRDTAFAITNVAGIDNPPGRIVAGAEAIDATKDKLRTVSEELEDMLEVSYAADTEPLERPPMHE